MPILLAAYVYTEEAAIGSSYFVTGRGGCCLRRASVYRFSMKGCPVEMKTVYVASSVAYFQHELDFEFEHEGETPEEAINYVAYRLGAEGYAYLNEITLKYYRVFDFVEYDEATNTQKVEPFKSELHGIRTLAKDEVRKLEAYKEGETDKQAALDIKEAARIKQEETARREAYERLKAEFEGK